MQSTTNSPPPALVVLILYVLCRLDFYYGIIRQYDGRWGTGGRLLGAVHRRHGPGDGEISPGEGRPPRRRRDAPPGRGTR